MNVSDMGYKTNHYIVFYPTQIKSAITNTGEFSSANPDIRYSRQDKPQPFSEKQIDELIKAVKDKRKKFKASAEALG